METECWALNRVGVNILFAETATIYGKLEETHKPGQIYNTRIRYAIFPRTRFELECPNFHSRIGCTHLLFMYVTTHILVDTKPFLVCAPGLALAPAAAC